MSRFAYNGVCLVSWQRDEYASEDGLRALEALAGTGANWAAVLTTWYQADARAVGVSPDERRTPSESALRCAVERLHSFGLRVMLKPHVDGLDGSWRGEFSPANTDAWFSSYGRYVACCADLAESLGIAALAVGTEFVRLSGRGFRRQWRELISDVRTRFSGLVTYAANAASENDEFNGVSFWDEVDLIGLDAYFPVTNGWEPYVPAIRRLSDRFEKPVIFAEIGYRSVHGADIQPWNHQLAGQADPALQADCYRAFFDAWSGQSGWMQGAFWWNWPAAASNPGGTDYSPRDKQAQSVLMGRFGVNPELERARRVEQLRRLVASGQYEPDPLAISRALVQRHLRPGQPED